MSLKVKVKEEKPIGKSDESDDDKILDYELEHVLCRLIYPKSDAKASKMRKIFLQHDITDWDDFVYTSE